MKRRRWHRWTVAVTPREGDNDPFARELAAAFNRNRRWFVLRRSARSTAHFYERQLSIPLNFYVIPVDAAERQAIPARFSDGES